jgi:hypothetical protein
MATGDLIEDVYDVELRGHLFAARLGFGLTGPPAGLGGAEQRVEDVDRPLEHGAFTGRAFYGRRTLLLNYAILGDTVDDALDKYLGELAAVYQPLDADVDGADTELAIRLGSRVYVLRGRPGRLGDPDLTLLPKGAALEAVGEFVATDPRIYDATVRTVTTGLGGIVGGLDLPHGFPHGFGAAEASTVDATNDGNIPTPAVIRFTAGAGGLTNPSVEHTATGQTIEVLIALADGDFLELDLLERTAVLNGTASRSNLVRRPGASWFKLAPGGNDLRFGAGGGDGTMLVTWRDAYTFG